MGDPLAGGDLAHRVVEGEAEEAHAEVDGVARQVSFGPAPVALLDDETGMVIHSLDTGLPVLVACAM